MNKNEDVHDETDCEICNSDWYKNIDYSKLRPLTDADREMLLKAIQDSEERG